MQRRNVWTLVDRKIGIKTIKTRWVFKQKQNGVYRARLCELGYMLVAGVDYNDVHSPVIQETTIRILCISIILMVVSWITGACTSL